MDLIFSKRGLKLGRELERKRRWLREWWTGKWKREEGGADGPDLSDLRIYFFSAFL